MRTLYEAYYRYWAEIRAQHWRPPSQQCYDTEVYET